MTQDKNDFTIQQLGPQVMMIFVPKFRTRKVVLRQLIMSNDWVADCQNLDEKYGVWFTTLDSALEILKRSNLEEI